jgi:hypothetical protein
MERVQVGFPEDTLRALRREAAVRGCSARQLVREAVEQVYVQPTVRKRLGIVAEMAAMSLPVADWPQMEEEIERPAV